MQIIVLIRKICYYLIEYCMYECSNNSKRGKSTNALHSHTHKQPRTGTATTNYETENPGGSLTDSSKLEQQRTDSSISQTDEHKAMHTPHICSHAAPNSVPCLADTGEYTSFNLLVFSVFVNFGKRVSCWYVGGLLIAPNCARKQTTPELVNMRSASCGIVWRNH